jgi:hypothetical protein
VGIQIKTIEFLSPFRKGGISEPGHVAGLEQREILGHFHTFLLGQFSAREGGIEKVTR